jgi:hypothetical protein
MIRRPLNANAFAFSGYQLRLQATEVGTDGEIKMISSAIAPVRTIGVRAVILLVAALAIAPTSALAENTGSRQSGGRHS